MTQISTGYVKRGGGLPKVVDVFPHKVSSRSRLADEAFLRVKNNMEELLEQQEERRIVHKRDWQPFKRE
jgi:hypothetical protein